MYLHFMNHQGQRFLQKKQKHLLFYKKKKVTHILDGPRVSKLTAHFHFWVNYPFKGLEPC